MSRTPGERCRAEDHSRLEVQAGTYAYAKMREYIRYNSGRWIATFWEHSKIQRDLLFDITMVIIDNPGLEPHELHRAVAASCSWLPYQMGGLAGPFALLSCPEHDLAGVFVTNVYGYSTTLTIIDNCDIEEVAGCVKVRD